MKENWMKSTAALLLCCTMMDTIVGCGRKELPKPIAPLETLPVTESNQEYVHETEDSTEEETSLVEIDQNAEQTETEEETHPVETDHPERSIYADVLNMFYKNISEEWANVSSPDEELPYKVSYLYYWPYKKNFSLSEVGYCLLDINNDGQEELIVSPIGYGEIYDMYTVVNGEVIHLFDSGERTSYTLTEDYSIIHIGSSGASHHVEICSRLNSDGTSRVQKAIILDDYDMEPTYYYAEGKDYNPEYNEYFKGSRIPISTDEAKELRETFPKGITIPLTPFSEYIPQ